jgi:hypothetical protein
VTALDVACHEISQPVDDLVHVIVVDEPEIVKNLNEPAGNGSGIFGPESLRTKRPFCSDDVYFSIATGDDFDYLSDSVEVLANELF